eukprot:6937670-Pyramimonas_sp.AAC.1
MGPGTHAACTTGAFGGALCGATNRVRGVPKLVPGRIRCHWGIRWSSLSGNKTYEGCAEMGPRTQCRRGVRWSSLQGATSRVR